MHYVRNVEEWPAQDQDAWRAAIAPGSLLEDSGTAGLWASATRDGAERGYGRWLAWLAERNALDATKDLAERVTKEMFQSYADDLRTKHATSSVVAYLTSLQQALRVMARDQDWLWMGNAIKLLKHTVTPARDKRPRLQPIGELFARGIELMRAAGSADGPLTPERAVEFRDGLMIALLAARPFRRRNFCDIRIGRHLVTVGDAYHIRFAAAETKNRQAIECVVPDRLIPFLRRYLEHYRPWLLNQTANRNPAFPFREPDRHLWISKTGSAMSEEGFYKGLRKRTDAWFGRSVNPHLFRDCLASSVATDDPDHVRIIRSLLGHASLATSERYYTHARATVATRRFQQHVLDLRKASRQGDDRPDTRPET